MALKRLALLAAGAGAAWYLKQRLSEDGPDQPSPPQQAQSPARRAAATPDPPTPPAQPQATEPDVETPAFQEPEVEPLAPADQPAAEEPPPAAFEDAHQEGWRDEQEGRDPAAVDELEIDPATAPDAREDVALEAADEVPEPTHDTTVQHPRTEPSHVTRVVDDLLEGRRDEAEEVEIEDATLVDESVPQDPPPSSS